MLGTNRRFLQQRGGGTVLRLQCEALISRPLESLALDLHLLVARLSPRARRVRVEGVQRRVVHGVAGMAPHVIGHKLAHDVFDLGGRDAPLDRQRAMGEVSLELRSGKGGDQAGGVEFSREVLGNHIHMAMHGAAKGFKVAPELSLRVTFNVNKQKGSNADLPPS